MKNSVRRSLKALRTELIVLQLGKNKSVELKLFTTATENLLRTKQEVFFH